MSEIIDPMVLQAQIAKGTWAPDQALTSICLANFNTLPYVGRRVFPMVGVTQAAGRYYSFDKDELARLTMKDKPLYGKVDPSTYRIGKDTFSVDIKQVILGMDDFETVNQTRDPFLPGAANPLVGPPMQVAEQMNMYLDYMFGDTFFKTGKWNIELASTASATNYSGNVFKIWSDNASDPIKDIRYGIQTITKYGRRKPNKLVLGADAYNALIDHPDLIERVKYSGAVGSPAIINTNVLAAIFGLEEVMVSETSYNAAGVGDTASTTYALTPDAALLLYAPNSAALNTPSAGMTFVWDMGIGAFMPVRRYDSSQVDPMAHASYIEGLLAVDMKVTGQDMAVYYHNVV
jgi:hypothetical protein